MTLSEKIAYCRRRSGLSQEALAERLGVSRQAVSKWETGDATPELDKLRALSEAFRVTADWLLSDAEPEDDAAPEPDGKSLDAGRTWLDELPGFLGTMIRRYGWLYGVYTALGGLGFILIGALARVLTRQMFAGFGDFGMGMGFGGSEVIWYDGAGNVIAPPPGAENLFPSAQSSFTSPMMTFGGVIIGVGVVFLIAGVALAVYLKGRDKKD